MRAGRRRRRHGGWTRVALLAIGAIMLWLAGVAASIISYGATSDSGSADVVIILGAAINGNVPSPVFEERLRHGLYLYRAKRVRRIILTGGYGEGAQHSESKVGSKWLRGRGVPEGAILGEERSRTTRQNLIEAKRLMKDAGFRSALVISDPFHMRRAMTMAAGLGMKARPSPTPTSRYRSIGSKAPFLGRELYFLHHYWFFRR